MAIKTLFGVDDYEAFNLGLEDEPHIAIPRNIRGNFSLLTAPSGMYGYADVDFYIDITDWDRVPVFPSIMSSSIGYGGCGRAWMGESDAGCTMERKAIIVPRMSHWIMLSPWEGWHLIQQ